MKDLFKIHQAKLLKLANNYFGRVFLGINKEIKPREKIVKIEAGSYQIQTGRNKRKAVVRTYPVFARKLSVALSKIEILDSIKQYRCLNQYQSLLNYCGLFEQPRIFPRLLLNTFPPIYAGAADGFIEYNGGNTWNEAHNAVAGNNAGDAGASSQNAHVGSKYDGKYYVHRCFWPFDTSVLGKGAIVNATVLKIYGFISADTSVSAQKGTQGATIEVEDFDAFSGSLYGWTSWAINKYNSITFNSTGNSEVAVTSTTYICTREKARDYDNWDPGIQYENGCYFSEETDTSKDPKLEITFTPGSEIAFIL